MANVSRPAGLQPLEYIDGSPWSGKCRQFYIPQTDGNAYAIGDPVALVAGADSSGAQQIVLATAGAGNALLGAIVGFGGSIYGGPGATPGALESTVIPATKTKAYYVLVTDDPSIIYSCQESTDGAALTASVVGHNADLKSGTNTGYVSGWMFNNTTAATGATKQLQLMGLVQTSDNAFGANAKWKVRINNHNYTTGTAGV